MSKQYETGALGKDFVEGYKQRLKSDLCSIPLKCLMRTNTHHRYESRCECLHCLDSAWYASL